MGETDERFDRCIGKEYLSTRRGLVGTAVRAMQYRRMSHFWLDLGNVCALVPVMGTVGVDVFPPEDVARARRRSRRYAADVQRHLARPVRTVVVDIRLVP